MEIYSLESLLKPDAYNADNFIIIKYTNKIYIKFIN